VPVSAGRLRLEPAQVLGSSVKWAVLRWRKPGQTTHWTALFNSIKQHLLATNLTQLFAPPPHTPHLAASS